VAKELLTNVSKDAVKKHVIAQKVPSFLRSLFGGGAVAGSPADESWQLALFKAREAYCTNDLAFRLHSAKSGGEPLFETWMLKESDRVQRLALAYGERVVLEQFSSRIGQLASSDCAEERALVPTLTELRSLYALSRVQADAAQLMSDGLMNVSTYQQVDANISTLCASLGDKAIDLADGFGIPEHMHHAPIAKDWAGYNSFENNGELTETARGIFREQSAEEYDDVKEAVA